MKYVGVQDNHKILITYGLKNNSYGKVVVKAMKNSGINPTVKALPNTSHNMSKEAIQTIKNWINKIILE